MMDDTAFSEFLDESIPLWRDDPVMFFREVLNFEPDEWQAQAARDLAANPKVSIKSGQDEFLTKWAPVLTYIGCYGCTEGCKYCGKNILDLTGSRESGHMYRSVNIDRALYNNGSDCCNRKLQSHRNSKLQKSAKTVPAYLKILPFQMKDRKSFYNINQAAHCRNSLCDHCGISASFYTHSKDYNKNYIQNNIDHS